MIACHSLHTHILCLIEHSLKDQHLNILFSSPLHCVALGLMCCIIQTLLCKQIFYTSIFAACCSSTTVLPNFERICFHNACISHVLGNGNVQQDWGQVCCVVSTTCGFVFQPWCFPCPLHLSLLSSCKADPRNVHSASQKMRNSSLFMTKAEIPCSSLVFHLA